MASWLSRLTRPRATPNDLARRLADYPPYRAPHAGPPKRWSPAQAHENLQHLLAHLDERLAALASLLRDQGIDPAPALAGGDPLPLIDQLHDWAGATWPALHRPEQGTLAHWLASTREGTDIAFSMVLDTALLLGELIRRGDSRWVWAIDEDARNRRDGMVSAMRPVLMLRSAAPGLPDVLIDLEDEVVAKYRKPDMTYPINPWRRTVSDALAGRYDPVP
ncbi:MAG: hypothetical protein ACJ8GJ_20415 [Vitreoscilla sp.]